MLLYLLLLSLLKHIECHDKHHTVGKEHQNFLLLGNYRFQHKVVVALALKHVVLIVDPNEYLVLLDFLSKHAGEPLVEGHVLDEHVRRFDQQGLLDFDNLLVGLGVA